MSSEILFEYDTVEIENKYTEPSDNIQSLLDEKSAKGWRFKGIFNNKILIFERVNPQQSDYITKLKNYLSS